MSKTLLAAALMGTSSIVAAQGFSPSNLYFGGGLSSNKLSYASDNATGFQFFGGYELDMLKLGPLDSAVEIGYMDSGEWDYRYNYWYGYADESFSASGLWSTFVVDYDFTPEFGVLARAGYDFGDDDGLMHGIGAAYRFTPELEVRGEFVMRDHIDSLQANLVYRLP
ncbi:MAG: outer membrane beta-barrel protein [Pseudomonadota bacterium]